MSSAVCPKCGFEQQSGYECARCGIIFARYRKTEHPGAAPPANDSQPLSAPPRPGLIRSAWRVLRWVYLAALVVVFILMLRPATPPRIACEPAAVQNLEARLGEFRQSVDEGRPDTLEVDEAALNGWLDKSLAIKRRDGALDASTAHAAGPADSPTKAAADTHIPQNPDLEQVQSSVRDVKIQLNDSSMRAYVSFDFHGKEISLELEGQIAVRDGYLRLIPSAGKIGSLPLPTAALENAASRLFDSPQNRDKFRVPPEIRDVHIERGQLLITSR